MSQFIQLLAKTVVGQVDTFSQAALRKITSFFSSYRPTVSFDELTGSPAVLYYNSGSKVNDGVSHHIMDTHHDVVRQVPFEITALDQIYDNPAHPVAELEFDFLRIAHTRSLRPEEIRSLIAAKLRFRSRVTYNAAKCFAKSHVFIKFWRNICYMFCQIE